MDWEKAKADAIVNIKDFSEKMDKMAKESKEKGIRAKQETKIKLTKKVLGQVQYIYIRRDINGLYYISPVFNEYSPKFEFENLEFKGSKIIQKTTGTSEQQGRAGSALVGGLLAGSTGASIGGSRRRKSKIDTTTKIEEKEGKGVIYLRNLEDGTIKKVKFLANSADLANIERFFN